MTTDRAVHPLTALIPVGKGGSATLSEALLSLAAQTCPDFDVVVTVTPGDAASVEHLGALVQSFDEEFSTRVQVVAMGGGAPDAPLTRCAELSRATYVSVVDPEDVVFAHWAETIITSAPEAGGRAIASLTAVQPVEHQHLDRSCVVTSVGPPRRAPMSFDLAHHLVSGPVSLGGLALPRLSVLKAIPSGLPEETVGWVAQLVVALTCGTYETGKVTYLRRRPVTDLAPTGDDGAWERDRDAALQLVDQGGLSLAPGVLAAVQSAHSQTTSGPAEQEQLEEALRQAIAAADAHAAAAASALVMLSEVRSSASWRLSAPLRVTGSVLRRFRR
jgi:hypothetical protein